MSLPISGFTAVPNPQMLAFMAAQSFVMMMQAGEGWQYGKRKQSAMTNEEFNKQTPLSIMQRQMSELKQAIPTIEKSMNAMTPMIRTIVIQYGDFMKEIISALPAALTAAQGGQTLTGNISTVGQELRDIIANLIPKLPSASATLVTNNPNPPSPPSSLTVDAYAHRLGTHAGHTVGNIGVVQGPTQGPPAPPKLNLIPSPTYSVASLAWIKERDQLITLIHDTKSNLKAAVEKQYSGSSSAVARYQLTLRIRANVIIKNSRHRLTQMSNQYRSSDNAIRNNALTLRQLLATGKI